MDIKQKNRYGEIKKEISRLSDELYKIASYEGYQSKTGLLKIEELHDLYKEKLTFKRFNNPKDVAMLQFLAQALKNKDDEEFKKRLKGKK